MTQGWKTLVSCCIKPAVTDVSQPGESDFLKLCQRIIVKLEDLIKINRSSQEHLMNEKQCVLLVKKLSATLTDIQDSSPLDEKTSPVLQELQYVFEDAERLIQYCWIESTTSNEEWLRAAIEKGDMKDTFAKLLYDVEWHTDVLQSILHDRSTTFEKWMCQGNLSPKDNSALVIAREKDDKVLNDRLRSLELDDPTEKRLLVELLKQREERATKAQVRRGSKQGVLKLDQEIMEKHVNGSKLGKGSSGLVRQTDVLGGNFAVKIFNVPDQAYVSLFMNEMEAMEKLGHHPNIVPLYGYAQFDDRCFLVMERMHVDLELSLGNRSWHEENSSIVGKVTLMLVIAEGMRYIHSMSMAHRDLKPANVLMNLENPEKESSRACSVKIADFGLTKTKNASKTYKDQTTNTGTSRYMAPEVIGSAEKLRSEFNPTKADVYSFGIMCSEILTRKRPFGDIPIGDLKKQVQARGDFRPDLDVPVPLRLDSLIRRCWDADHRSRPPFDEICQELRYIKGLLLRGDEEKLNTKINFIAQGQVVVSEKGTVQFSPLAAPAKATPDRQGPWGRNEPGKKSGLFDHVAATIKRIGVKYQQDPPGVGLLEVGYLEADGQELMETYCQGIIGTTYTEIKFKSGEYVKQVSGCVATHPVSVGNGGTVGLYCVVSLTIHTNCKSYGPFGDETKCVVRHRFKSGTGKVVGLFGAAGILLDKLGVWIIPDDQEDGDPSYTEDQ